MKCLPALAAILLATPITSRAESPSGNSEFERVRNSFGNLQTIAGRGTPEPYDDANQWLASMEGGPATSAELSRPHMAMADRDGNVYIADKQGHAIRKVTLDGTIHTIAGTSIAGDDGDTGIATQMRLNEPNGLFTFPDGTTYILDLANSKIRRIDTDGTMTTILTDTVGINVLRLGRGLWVNHDGSLIYYCAGTDVRRWTPSASIEVIASGFSELGNLDVDPQGNVVVTDRGTHLVTRINADGSKSTIAGNGSTSGGGSGLPATSTGLNEVRGIAFYPDGSYLLCTHRDSQVWFVDTDQIIWLLINGHRSDSTHAGDGQRLIDNPTLQKISEPRAVTIAPNGDLLITENDNGFIRRVTNICINPEIVTAHLSSSHTFDLTFTSQREAAYDIELSNDLTNWDLASTVPASNGTTTTYHDTTAANNHQRQFYRVKEN